MEKNIEKRNILMDLFGVKRRTAVISDCGRFRYRLTRTWDPDKPSIIFIMLNPSTADADTDDQTIRKCMKFAQKWGYGELIVANLFAFRATDPSELLSDPISKIGVFNDHHLLKLSETNHHVVFAWGNYGIIGNRANTIINLFPEAMCLKINSTGQPKHPLYVPDNSTLTNYK